MRDTPEKEKLPKKGAFELKHETPAMLQAGEKHLGRSKNVCKIPEAGKSFVCLTEEGQLG